MVSRKNGIWPRALGARSILADPRREKCKQLNLKIKFRESFRPLHLQLLKQKTGFKLKI